MELARTHEYSIIEINKKTYLIVANVRNIQMGKKVESLAKLFDLLKKRSKQIPYIEKRNTKYWSLKVKFK